MELSQCFGLSVANEIKLWEDRKRRIALALETLKWLLDTRGSIWAERSYVKYMDLGNACVCIFMTVDILGL